MTATQKQYDPDAQHKSAAYALEECAITPTQERLWTETRTALLWHCPAFSHILYTMMNPKGNTHIARFTKNVPIAATDGINLFLNPDRFFKLTLMQRVFVVSHEIMHCIWDHCGLMHAFKKRGKIGYVNGKSLPYSSELMNIATDLVINDMLIESKVGTFLSQGVHDKSIATGNDSAIDAYAKLFKQAMQNNKAGKKDGIPISFPHQGKGFDEHLTPGAGDGKDPTQATQERSPQEWQTAVAAAMAAAKVQGKLPAGLERMFGDILNPQVSWSDKLEALFARKVGSGGYDWRRADRRLITRDEPIFAPGRSGHGAGTVVVGVDTSGSIGPSTLDMFFAEMSGILEDVRPKQMLVIWCDAAVHRVDDLEDARDLQAVRSKKAPGGGGTDFRPVFDWISKHDIQVDALVFLTDGYGSFPDRAPAYPTIWGSITKDYKYPFGDVVEIPNGS